MTLTSASDIDSLVRLANKGKEGYGTTNEEDTYCSKAKYNIYIGAVNLYLDQHCQTFLLLPAHFLDLTFQLSFSLPPTTLSSAKINLWVLSAMVNQIPLQLAFLGLLPQ